MVILPGTADGTSNDPLIAATAGGLVLYFVREYSQVLGFWFDMAKETSPQPLAITQLAVSPGR
ncbi:hypothetical protein BO443_140061 [Burkholderia orbicola]